MTENTTMVLEEKVRGMVYELSGQKVMQDFDLAKIIVTPHILKKTRDLQAI